MPDPAAADPLQTSADRKPGGAGLYVVGLVVAILVVYGRLFGADFTWWDDQGTIHHNSFFNPPTADTLRYYWTTMTQGLYTPVTWTVWAGIAKLSYVGIADDFGISLNPFLFHAANIAWHTCSAILVFFIARRLLGVASHGPAFVTALVFALHPVQVESVGWVSGMKDLLCWLGVLGIVLLYVRRVQATQATGRPLWASWEMPAACLVLALAILSKPTAMVTPAALVAIDGLVMRRRWVRSVVELIPLFAITAAGAVVARVAQEVGLEQHVSPIWRPLIVGDALCHYLTKLVWPATLTVDYGRTPLVALADRWTYVRWIVPAAVGVALLVVHRRLPWLALAGLLLLIGIAPVSGLATFQMQRVSTTTDHYLYFSMLGPALAAGWAMTRWPTTATRAIAAVAIVALGARAFVQTAAWRDTFALFEQAIAANPMSSMARNNLVLCYLGKLDREPLQAERWADEAILVAPDDVITLWNYGVAKSHVNKFDDSERAFERAWTIAEEIQSPPGLKFALSEAAYTAMIKAQRYEGVERWGLRALEQKPDDAYVSTMIEGARKEIEKRKDAQTRRAATTTAAPAPGPASAP